ncbi:MAG: orotate phosphoribosyltransferase [Gemmatimonadetes bacterium]|nr:orotate phosphoribosyltransferase [Gemmatimonadota bacterium]
MTAHEQLVRLLATRSAKRGDFVLASGRRSSLYIDCRLTTMSPEGQLLIGREGLAALRHTGWTVDAVGGLTLGADPIAYAMAHASALAHEQGTGAMVRGFTVRKEPKQHGTGKRVEGPFQVGDRVVVVEDVITTGGSALKAVEAIREAGGHVLGVLALVDREEGGREVLEGAGLPVVSMVRATELLALMERAGESGTG